MSQTITSLPVSNINTATNFMALSALKAQDAFTLPITGADETAARGYDEYVLELLSYGPDLRDLFDIADHYPGCALLNAHAAALHLSFEGAQGWVAAQPYLQRMRDARKDSITQREALFCDAMEAWVARDYFQALTILDALTVRWPADLCAIKWGQYHAFNLGDQEALLRFGQRALIVHKQTPYAHGLIAFALEQNHKLREAEEEGKRAVAIAADDAWAHHAIAHVFESRRQIRKGIRWMNEHAHTWEKKGIFIRDHNWWHTALFNLAADNQTEVMKIYDNRLWGSWPEFPQEQLGAVSILWRLEILGANVGERWSPVIDQVRAHAGDHILPFHDIHYAYALSRSGANTEADAFITSLEKHASICNGDSEKVWQGVCLPLAKAVTAFGRGQHEKTIQLMQPILRDLHRIGGSHAQRQVFLDTYETARALLMPAKLT